MIILTDSYKSDVISLILTEWTIFDRFTYKLHQDLFHPWARNYPRSSKCHNCRNRIKLWYVELAQSLWLAGLTFNNWMPVRLESIIKTLVISLSKRLYPHSSVLVGSSKRLACRFVRRIDSNLNVFNYIINQTKLYLRFIWQLSLKSIAPKLFLLYGTSTKPK